MSSESSVPIANLRFPSWLSVSIVMLGTVVGAVCIFGLMFLMTVRVVRIHAEQLHWDIAAHLAQELDPQAAGTKSSSLVGMVRALLPGLEIYLTDREGTIIFPESVAAQQKRVPLETLRRMLSDHAPDLPIAGVDPIHEGRTTMISVAEAARAAEGGYVYVTVATPALEAIESNAGRRAIGGELGMILLPGLICLLPLAVVTLLFTRKRFTRVETLLDRALDEGVPLESGAVFDDEVSLLCSDIIEAARTNRESLHQLDALRRKRQAVLLELIHDLRAPVAGLAAGVEIMRRDWSNLTSSDHAKLCDAARSGLATENRFLNQLRSVELLQMGPEKVFRKSVDTAELMRALVERMVPLASSRDIALELVVRGDLPEVLADPELLERAMTNLIDNALQHTPRGGTVSVRLERRLDRIALEVQDTGSGIATEDLPLIFKPFYRGAAGEATRKSGAGLGLAIVQRIAELNESSVEVQSPPNSPPKSPQASGQKRGATFCFSIPVRSTEAASVSRDADSTSLTRRRFFAPLPIDSLDVYHLLAAMLLVLALPASAKRLVLIGGCYLLVYLLSALTVRLPEAARRELKSILRAAWWIAVPHLGSVGQIPRSIIAYHLFWIPFGTILGTELLRRQRMAIRMFVLMALVLGGYRFLVDFYPSALMLVALSVGLSGAYFLNGAFRRNREYGLIFRVMSLTGVVAMAVLCWQTYALNRYWSELVARRVPPALLEAQMFAPGAASGASLSPEILSHYLLGGALSSLLIRKLSQSYLIGFFVLQIFAGLSVAVLLFVLFAPRIRRVVAALRTVVLDLDSEPIIEAVERSPALKQVPLFAALCTFSRKIRASRRLVADDDAKTRRLILGVVEELSGLCERAEEAFSAVETTRLLGDSPRPPPVLRGLEALLETERKIIDMLFRFVQRRPIQGAEEAPFALGDVVEDLVAELAGFAQQRGVALTAQVEGAASLSVSYDVFHEALFGLVAALLQRANAGDRIEMSTIGITKERVLVIRGVRFDGPGLCSRDISEDLFREIGMGISEQSVDGERLTVLLRSG